MKKSLRFPRLTHNFAPCTLSSRLTADNALVVEFTFPANMPDATHWAIGIVEAAETLSSLFRHFTQHLDRQERNVRMDALNDHWRIRQREVQQVYLELRRGGIGHRAAIQALLVDPRFDELRSRYRWDSAEFNATVKSYLGPVPLHSTPSKRRD